MYNTAWLYLKVKITKLSNSDLSTMVHVCTHMCIYGTCLCTSGCSLYLLFQEMSFLDTFSSFVTIISDFETV